MVWDLEFGICFGFRVSNFGFALGGIGRLRFLGKHRFNVAHDQVDRALRVAEEMWRPQPMQMPPLALMHRGAKHIPLDRIMGLIVLSKVAEDADGHVLGPIRMVQRQIDPEALVAPVHVAGHVACVDQAMPERMAEQRDGRKTALTSGRRLAGARGP